MDGNAYSRIVRVIRNETEEQSKTGETDYAGLGASPLKARLGTVTQRVPLKIKVAGVELPTEVLRINERLTKGAKWKEKITSPKSDYTGLSGSLSGPVACSGDGCNPQLSSVTAGDIHSTDTTVDEAEVEQLEVDLDVDDQVLLVTEDDQIFYIVMKVVKAV